MSLKDTYRTIEKASEGLYKDKGSKFISFLFPVRTEDEVKDILHEIKKEHFSARHHCYAYRLGDRGERYRMNDDGEPSGTGGKPIYGQIVSCDLTNVLIIVVRYFGGTLLGVSGLINAYRSAAADVLNKAEIVEKLMNDFYRITCDYQTQSQLTRILKETQAEIIQSKFTTNCEYTISVRQANSLTLFERLNSIYAVTIERTD